jgi:glycosyltransferase involved in cell wall biosynthesis
MTQQKNKPTITVVTVVFNGRDFIEKTIQSVIKQTYQNIEYIIIDGGSTDGTLDVIKKYGNKIDYWVSAPDKGIYDAMNKGIARAKGDWIYFINAGDSLFSVKTLENLKLDSLSSSTDVLYGNINFIDPQTGLGSFHNMQEIIDINFLIKSNICHQALIYKTKLFVNFKGYDAMYKICADYDKLLQLFLADKLIKKVNLTICNYLEEGRSRKSYITSNIERLAIIKSRFGFVPKYYVAYHYALISRAFIYSLRRVIRNVFRKLPGI